MGTETETVTEWDAASYQKLSGPQFAWGQKVLARVPLRGDEVALDAGCGTGRLTAELVERLPRGRVVGVDRSENMVAEAASLLAPRFGERVAFRAVDLLSLDESEAYDVVFSTATFHWILDHPRLFRVLRSALRPGGLLVAQCGGHGNLERFEAIAARVEASEVFAPFFAGWPGEWEFAGAGLTAERLRAAGFVDVETDIEDAPTPFAGAVELASFVRRIVLRPHLQRLPDEALRARFLDEVVAGAGAADPPYTLDYKRLNIKARRAEW